MNQLLYNLRLLAQEGEIFFQNRLADPSHVKKYFPPSPSEKSYSRRPKIVSPVFTSIVNRIVNFTTNELKITYENVAPEITDYYTYEYELNNLIIRFLTDSLVYGNVGVYLTQNMISGITELSAWDTRYIQILDNALLVEYLEKDGVILPIMASMSEDEKDYYKSYLITSDSINGIPHNLPFAPYNIFRCIDKYYLNPKYGTTYNERTKRLNVEYNHILSQISKQIKIMQNVWSTNRLENPNEPISLDPERINFLGENGTLSQVVRELNITPEMEYIKELRRQISEASNVPNLSGNLEDVAGKIPSGVALTIAYQPLIDLVNRLRPIFIYTAEQLIYKLVYAESLRLNKPTQNINVKIEVDSSVFDEGEKTTIDDVLKLKADGIINDIEARKLLADHLDLEVEMGSVSQ